jgi:hypothetical protein
MSVRNLLIVGTVLLVIFVAVFRQRIFLRDPLGRVERNGIRQQGARVFINYTNDVLLEDTTRNNRYLIEGWNKLPGVPKHLVCLTGLVCWTEANQAEVFPLGNAANQTVAVMSSKEIAFEDETGAAVRAELR